jgi:hypothetical protein
MKIGAAREELAQYIATSTYECPGGHWGYCQRHYSDVNGPVTSRTWSPGWQGTRRTVRWSLQLCIPGAETFPSPQAYAAQINWTKSIRRLLSREPDWRDVPAPLSYDTPEAVTRAAWGAGTVGSLHLAAKGEELGIRFARALRATGAGWEREVLRDWRRPAVKAKRTRKAQVAAHA